jgi:hypothetical protein
MKAAVFHREAKTEVAAASRWYESQSPGLGRQFREEVKTAISRIIETPEAFGTMEGEIRCHMLHRFPYGVLYQVHADRVFIVAIMRLHRDPEYWQHRL